MNTITQSIRRLVRVLCPFLLLFLSFTAVAQTKGITLNLNDVPLKEALGKIEKDYGFVFLYNEKEITLDKNVNCTFRNADIGTVMSKILGADYSFKVKNRQIVILPNHAGTSQGKQSTALPSYLNSAQYAELYNEAGENDSRITGSTYIPRFTAEDIALYKNHEDPLLHPDTDWIGTFLRKFSTRTQHNVNVSGGIDKVKYFISGSFFDQTGIYKNTRLIVTMM